MAEQAMRVYLSCTLVSLFFFQDLKQCSLDMVLRIVCLSKHIERRSS